MVATELGLEGPPPMAAFNNHTLPSAAEPPYTKLVDSRWIELVLSKVSDVDALHEKKKKLAGRRNPSNPAADAEPPKPTPKKGAKGGGKGEKGGGKTAAGSDLLQPRANN